jgi:hypothetical protein
VLAPKRGEQVDLQNEVREEFAQDEPNQEQFVQTAARVFGRSRDRQRQVRLQDLRG